MKFLVTFKTPNFTRCVELTVELWDTDQVYSMLENAAGSVGDICIINVFQIPEPEPKPAFTQEEIDAVTALHDCAFESSYDTEHLRSAVHKIKEFK